MSELKPCPFCGGEARTFRSLSTEDVYVICDSDECMACGPIKDAEDTAACAWNTRPDSLALTAAEDDAQRLRELVCAEDLGDFVKMSGKRPHEIGRYLIDLWQEDIQGREREKALALSAAVQGEREAIKATLTEIAMIEHGASSEYFSSGHPIVGERWNNHAMGIEHAIEIIEKRPSPAVDVMAVVREFVDACDEYADAHKTGITITDAKRERIVDAFDRYNKAGRALRSLVTASPKAEKKENA